ncbi:MAG: hypothetical protein R3321_03075, partial [Nitrososphaeraceae archaeon]|nr:hypothetical protein [Nitrososphaeraceae archaeon]
FIGGTGPGDSDALLCAIQNIECTDGSLLVDVNTVEPECEVANVILPPEAAGGIALEVGKGVECALNEDNPANNLELCTDILGEGTEIIEGDTVVAGPFGPLNYDMLLTSDSTTPPNEFLIDNTEFILDVDEGVAIKFVPPGSTYQLTEIQIQTSPTTTIPILTDTIPAECQAIAQDESEGEPIGFTATGFAELDEGAIMCVIIDNLCVNGLLVDETTLEPACEVANVVATPVGIASAITMFGDSSHDTQMKLNNLNEGEM